MAQKWKARSVQNCILPSVSCVCCCGLGVEQQNLLIFSREKWGTKTGSAESTSGGTGVLTPGFVAWLLADSQSLREAAH